MSERELEEAVEAARKILNGHPSGMGYPIGEMCRDAALLARAYLSSRPLILEEAAKVAREEANRWKESPLRYATARNIEEELRRLSRRSLSHDGKAPDKEGGAG